MKKSRYNSLHTVRGQEVLYNAFSEKMCVMDPEVARIYTAGDPDAIKEVHPSFHSYLCEQGFLVDDALDEAAALIDTWRRHDTDPSRFSLAVNPTLNCNFSCWYCYENHSGNLNMSDAVFERLARFIVRKLSEPELKQFHLGFFGGEPLLNFDRVGRRLIELARGESAARNVDFSVSFVTNGYLVSDPILEFLDSLGCPVTFQITLDGNETNHNNVRKTRAGEGSYGRILDNCAKILRHESMFLVLRCNFTEASLPTFLDVAADVKARFLTDGAAPANLSVDFHRVWQDKDDSRAVESREQDVKSAFSGSGFKVSANKRFNRYRCYADGINNALVNYDGNVFRCTARDFTADRAEGVLTDGGEIEWNEKSAQRDAIKWANRTCADCNIYPICCGNCSQSKLESGIDSGCYQGYSAEDKEAVVRGRVEWLIAESAKEAKK